MRNPPFGDSKEPISASKIGSFRMRNRLFRKPKEPILENSEKSAVRRVCLFGGSFNPIHYGHLAVARAALHTQQIDVVWFMVSPQNPFKANNTLLDDEKRLQMVSLAIENEERMTACDYEFRLPRPSYTWHTLLALGKDYPAVKFSLLIGGDNWAKFSDWFHAADILARHRIIVYPRSGYAIDAATLPRGVSLLDTPLCNISSTLIREKLRRSEPIDDLMPPSAAAMAQKYYLYRQ